jgi:polyketide synthase 7
VRELTLVAPLVLAVDRSVQVQVGVGAVEESSGTAAVSVYARDSQSGSGWILHAEGVVVVDPAGVLPAVVSPDLSVWPPQGAVAFDVSGIYERLAARGYDYGRAFQGVRAAWRRGDDVFADIAVPEDLDVSAMGIHPALLDAALHVGADIGGSAGGDDGGIALPFAWHEVCLHGVGAARLRVHLSLTGDDTLSVELADSGGTLVFTGALTTRPVGAEQLQAALTTATVGADSGLLEVVWTPVTVHDCPAGPVVSWAEQTTEPTESTESTESTEFTEFR